MGTGREPGIFLCEKIQFYLRIAGESEKVFARILDEFLGVLISQKQVFFVDKQFKISRP